MSQKTRLGRGIPLSSQSKELIFNLYEYWTNESDVNVVEKTANALKLSTHTVKRVASEKRKNGELSEFKSPITKWKKSQKKLDLSNFDKGVIRRTIHNFYIVKKQLPTLLKLHKQLKEDINFNGGMTSIWKIVKSLGFKWRKIETNKKILMERVDIVTKRVDYLRSLSRYRLEGRPIIYMDETYFVHSSQSSSNSWSNSPEEAFEMSISKGSKFIIVHAGGTDGFVPCASLIYQSYMQTGDDHDMNYEKYEKWLKTQLIPNLPPRSVLIIDTAPYNNKTIDPVPNSNSQKRVMVEWLERNFIPSSSSMLKTDLYKLIVLSKPRIINYKVDLLLAAHGHNVLRLPPNHPELNPIGNVWSVIKRRMASNNIEITVQSIQRLVEGNGEEMTEIWKKMCQHVEEVEKKYTENDNILDTILDESFVFDVENSSSEEWSSEELTEDE